MKSPIVFRASFQQPLGALNPIGAKFLAPIWVEIFHWKIGPPAGWKARRPGTEHVFEEITPQSTPTALRNQIAGVYFEKQLTPWVAFDATIADRPEELRADEWGMDNQGKVFLVGDRKKTATPPAEKAPEAPQ